MNVITIRVNDLIIVMEFLCCILTVVNAFTDDTSPADNIGYWIAKLCEMVMLLALILMTAGLGELR